MKKTIVLSLICGAAILTINSCKEEKELRSKQYTMTEFDTSGVSGTVEFKETDDDKTTVTVHMHGTVDGGSYPAHIHSGPITNPGGVVFDLGPFVSSGGTAEGSKTLDMTYDDMINYDGCFVSHDPNDITDYVLVGNIGSNNP